MAYDEKLAERVRAALAKRDYVVEKRMFGGIAFMVRGHMSCGIVASTLMVRLAPADADGLMPGRHLRLEGATSLRSIWNSFIPSSPTSIISPTPPERTC